MNRQFGFSTIAIHGIPQRRADWTPIAPAVQQSSTFVNPVGSDDEVLYSRYGNNPNHLAMLRPGDHLISSTWIYGGTQHLFDKELARFGIEVTYVNPDQPRHWRKAVRKSTRAIFVETPTNPLMRVIDLGPIAYVAEEEGLGLLVDATFASPINFRPIEHGADVVITSATKYLNGHSDVIAGAIAGSTSFIEEVNRLMRLWGQAIDPHAAWLIDRGMRTLAVRMDRHNANGMAVAQWAEQQDGIAKVHYPGLPSHPDHAYAKTALSGFGGMVGLELEGGAKAAERLLKRLKMIAHAPSLAGVETLVSEPRLTSHKDIGAEGRAKIGIPDGFLRLSCGLEDAADIIGDLEQALN
jgi:cystathionine beta-lyase/cystathionine gamma-synthase